MWLPQSHLHHHSNSHIHLDMQTGARGYHERKAKHRVRMQGAGAYHRVVLCHQAELVHANEANQLLGIDLSPAHVQIPPVIVHLESGKDTCSHSCPLLPAPPPEALIALTHRDTHPWDTTICSPPLHNPHLFPSPFWRSRTYRNEPTP